MVTIGGRLVAPVAAAVFNYQLDFFENFSGGHRVEDSQWKNHSCGFKKWCGREDSNLHALRR
jgi:hypothetical protein